MKHAPLLALLLTLLIVVSGCIVGEKPKEEVESEKYTQSFTEIEKQTETPKPIIENKSEREEKEINKTKQIIEEGITKNVSLSGRWEPIGPDGGDMHFMYATREGILFASHGFAGVWRSEDGGNTWELIRQDNFIDLHFLSMVEYQGKLYAGTNKGLWLSKDKGKSWEKIITGIKDIDNGIYIISSLAIFNDKLFFASVLDKRYRNRKPGYGKLYYFENGKVKEFPIPKGADKEIVIGARDPYLFLSSPYSGLYVLSLKNPTWIKILDKKTTKVYVDDEYNLYVGTIGDWWYLGRKKGDGWKWEHLTLPNKSNNTIFHFLVPDPINKKRLWFGAGGISGIYSFSARGSGNAFVGVGCWDEKWSDTSIKDNFALSIAFLPGEKVSTKCGYATKYALIPQGGRESVMKTSDGGKTWKRSYNGIWGDTINAISPITSGLWKGSIAVTAVSGTQITKDFGNTWVEGIDFTLGRINDKLPGYHWIVISPNEKIKDKYDLLVSTGYPSPEGGDGVFGVDTSCLMSGGKECAEKILEGPHYEMVIIDDKLYAGSMEEGVDVLDLKTFKVSKITLPGAGVLVRYFDGKLFVGTYEEKRFIGDTWRFLGKRGRVYICDGKCKEIYDKYVISFFVKDGKFVALSNVFLIYKPDINSEKTVEVKLPKAEYSDMTVDWEDGLIFLSTFDIETPGVLWTTLDELKSGKVELRPLEKGLLTRQVRNLVYFSGYLFAGTEGQSVWRMRIKEVQSPKEEEEKVSKAEKETKKSKEAWAIRFGSWGHKGDEYSYIPSYGWIKPHPGPFNRYFIEKEKGVYDFSSCDEGVKRAQQTGAEIVATIWPYTDWDEEAYKGREGYGEATGDGPFAYVLPSSRFRPYDMQAYKAFVKALVERYDGDGIDDMSGLKYPIKYWEILNEPEAQKDNKYFFKGSGKEYFELVKASYEAIKEADPEAKVVLGGAATLQGKSVEWWEEFFSLGGANYFDIAAVHSYADEHDDFNVNELKALLKKYNADKPIWVTEVGPKPEMTEEDDVMFIKAAVRAFANGAEVLFFDYGPAITMASLIGDFKRVEKISEGVYKFKVGDDKVYVLWSPGEVPKDINGKVYVINIYGKVKEVDASEIKLTESPLYITKSEKIAQRVIPTPKPQKKEKEKKEYSELKEFKEEYFDENIVKESFGSLEIYYDSSTWKSYAPIDRWVKRWVNVKNIGDEKAVISFRVEAYIDGEWRWFNSFPQPQTLYLEPGESQNVYYFVDVVEGDRVREELPKKFRVIFENTKTGEEKEIYLKHEYDVIKEYVNNSAIEGVVFDEDGNPLDDVEILIESAHIEPRYIIRTGKDGKFHSYLFAHRYRDSKAYHGYAIEFWKPGYAVLRKVIFPKPGEIIKMNVTLKREGKKWNFELKKCYETYYPFWYVKVSKNEKYIIIAHGHHHQEEVYDEKHGIYMFDLEGNLLWKYHTTHQVWGIDISDDGNYVFAALLRDEYGILFDKNGNILWTTREKGIERFESREVKISHNNKYIAIGTTFGDLMLLDLKTGKPLWKVFLNGQVRQIRFSKDDSIIYANGDGYLYKISIDGKILGKTYIEAWTYRHSLSISEDEKYAFTISKIGKACLVDLENMKTLWCFDTRGGGHGTAIHGNFVALVSGGSYGRMLFDLKGNPIWLIPRVGGHVMFSEDGKYIVIDEAILTLDGDIMWSTFEECPELGEIEFSYLTRDKTTFIAVNHEGKLCVFKRKK